LKCYVVVFQYIYVTNLMLMNFFEFLSQYSHVEMVISLLAFIVAAVLGFFLSSNNSKLKLIDKIIKSADMQSKADLAKQLLEVFPSDKIPELTKQQGFEILKLNLNNKSDEFKSKMKIIKNGNNCTIGNHYRFGS